MGREFIVDGSYDGYTYVGHAVGNFETDNGELQPFYNMFVVAPCSTYTSDNYSAFGYKAEKKKCISADIFDGLVPGDKVKLFFDDKKRVVMVKVD